MYIYPLDKQIDVAIKIIKLIEKEKVTFSEYPFISELVNDIVNCQKQDLEYPDMFHLINNIKAIDTDNYIIKHEVVDELQIV